MPQLFNIELPGQCKLLILFCYFDVWELVRVSCLEPQSSLEKTASKEALESVKISGSVFYTYGKMPMLQG